MVPWWWRAKGSVSPWSRGLGPAQTTSGWEGEGRGGSPGPHNCCLPHSHQPHTYPGLRGQKLPGGEGRQVRGCEVSPGGRGQWVASGTVNVSHPNVYTPHPDPSCPTLQGLLEGEMLESRANMALVRGLRQGLRLGVSYSQPPQALSLASSISLHFPCPRKRPCPKP